MPLNSGQVLNNRYRIVKHLKGGGFGTVYRAWDMNLNLPCALKENTETGVEARRQFEREADFLAKLHHPNLPRVTDHFFVQGQGQYLVMDFVDGEDLQAMQDRHGGLLPESQVIPWIEQVCDALSHLHNRKEPIIHRDIKPANIRIKPEGKAMLVDFGIAKVYDPNTDTTEGAKAVTPGYSPFEQYGTGSTDSRTDIYALGATAYKLLTGQDPIESIERLKGKALLEPRSLNQSISTHVGRAIMKAMEVMQDDRFQTVDEFRTALKEPQFTATTSQTPLLPPLRLVLKVV